MNADDRVTYLQAVWAMFQARAKTQREMSPSEYYIAAKWADRNIPLPIVERGMSEFVGKPRMLSAMEASVARAYAYWFQAVGA
jgi:hypothetical protein